MAEHERRLERRLKVLENRLEQTINSARQIFAVAVDAVRELEPTGAKEKLEMYKVTLGRYHGLLIQDIRAGSGQEVTAAYMDSVVSEHKNKLINLKDQQGGFALGVDSLIDVLLSLRVNALQLRESEQRKAFVRALARGDVLLLKASSAVLLDMFLVPSHPLKCALSALLSILASTSEGLDYLTRGAADTAAIEKLVDLLKDQDDGSVTQRFCLAALQKACFIGSPALLEAVVTKKGAIEWL